MKDKRRGRRRKAQELGRVRFRKEKEWAQKEEC